MTHWLAALLLVSNLLFANFLPQNLGSLASAPAIQVVDLGTSYRFGDAITFNARFDSIQNVNKILLNISPSGQPAKLIEVPLGAEVHHTLDVSSLQLRPFAPIVYTYQFTFKDGQTFTSPDFSFQYIDNRFTWQKIEEKDFVIWWYGRDTAFGQDALNNARDGAKEAAKILPVSLPVPTTVIIYNSYRDLQSAWATNNQPWVAGYAQPDLNQVLISIPDGPEQKLELERQVPHELLHIAQYQFVKEHMNQQPVWLIEGMASLAELYPNSDYKQVLMAAVQKQELIPINMLCSSFPRDASGAFKAYAESQSFVRFLYQTYGADGMKALLAQYNQGVSCEQGLPLALGVSLDQLEYRWKQESLGIDPAGLVFGNLSPYLLLLALMVIPAAFIFLPASLHKKP